MLLKDVRKSYRSISDDPATMTKNLSLPFAPVLEKAAKGDIPWYKVLEEKGFKFRNLRFTLS